jgi:CheY-like chemotaxis protein
VLVVEDDPSLGDLLQAVFADEGYAVSLLGTSEAEATRFAVAKLEPDCLVLDGSGLPAAASAWRDAAWAAQRGRAVPVVLLTAHAELVQEAKESTSPRSRAAAFAGVVAKPFDLDELVQVVARAVGAAAPFDASPAAEAVRTAALVGKLTAAGAADVRTSSRREWANFYTPDGTLGMLYWSERDGVYYALRQADEGGTMRQVGRSYDLDTTVALATGPPAG